MEKNILKNSFVDEIRHYLKAEKIKEKDELDFAISLMHDYKNIRKNKSLMSLSITKEILNKLDVVIQTEILESWGTRVSYEYSEENNTFRVTSEDGKIIEV